MRKPKRTERERAENAALIRRTRQIALLNKSQDKRRAKIDAEYKQRVEHAKKLPHR